MTDTEPIPVGPKEIKRIIKKVQNAGEPQVANAQKEKKLVTNTIDTELEKKGLKPKTKQSNIPSVPSQEKEG
jgi:hypothetical protein